MSQIAITLLPEKPVIKDDFIDYLDKKEVRLYDYKLSDFDRTSDNFVMVKTVILKIAR